MFGFSNIPIKCKFVFLTAIVVFSGARSFANSQSTANCQAPDFLKLEASNVISNNSLTAEMVGLGRKEVERKL